MRIYTVTRDGRPVAVVRAETQDDAVSTARELGAGIDRRGSFAAREPNDGEMVSWLAHRRDHLLPEAAPLAEAS